MADLPPSEIDEAAYPKGPNGMAALCEARIEELARWKRIVPKCERGPINQHIHTLQGMVKWCKSRAGYAEPGRHTAWYNRHLE